MLEVQMIDRFTVYEVKYLLYLIISASYTGQSATHLYPEVKSMIK